MDLREMLVSGRVVEMKFFDKLECGIVDCAGDIHTVYGRYSQDAFDENLRSKTGIEKITKIYEYTTDGLKLIWNCDDVDWSKIKVDTKVQALINGKWKNRHFAGMERVENGLVLKDLPCVYLDGATSFTASTDRSLSIYICKTNEIRLYKEN